jgi:uncharacterized protein YdeI (BOF family)
MNRVSKLTAFLLLLAVLVLTGCGGGMNMGLEPNGTDPTAPGQPLPSVFDEFLGTPTRGASEVTSILGSAALSTSGGTVEGDKMALASTASEMAWALYKVEGLAGKQAQSISVEMELPSLTTEYSVGVANYSEGVWDFLHTGSLPELSIDLTEEQSRLVSQLGNLYFVVVVSGGASAKVLEGNVTSEDEVIAGERLPALVMRPLVSEGLAGQIEISWFAAAGADTYELWRMRETEPATEWELLATQAELSYIDTAVAESIEYKYRVRGVNEIGAGGFSRSRGGYMGPAPLGHEEEEDEDQEFEGTITAKGESSLTINGVELLITPNTIFEALLFPDIEVGMEAEVEADANGTGGWIAVMVEVEEEEGGGGGDETRWDGAIDVISASGATVAGIAVLFDARTEFNDVAGDDTDWSYFVVGQDVEVRAVSNGKGGLIAERFRANEAPGGGGGGEEETFSGTITALDDDDFMVGAQEFEVTSNTTYSFANGDPATFADLAVGLQVSVLASFNGDDDWIAISVTIGGEGGGGGEDEQTFAGAVEALGEDDLTVQGTLIDTDLNTVYTFTDGSPATHADLAVGLQVEVLAQADGDGGWLALTVQIEGEAGPDEQQFLGELTALSTESITVGAQAIALAEETNYIDNLGNPAAFEDLALGQILEVQAFADGIGGWIATLVKIEGEIGGGEDQTFTGAVEAVGDDDLTVQGTLIDTDLNTVYTFADGSPATHADLAVGVMVEVNATDDGDGGWLATAIQIEGEGGDPGEEVNFSGTIEALSETSITVAGQAIALTATTEYRDNNGDPATWADFAVGELADVDAIGNATDGYTALVVKEDIAEGGE